MKRLYKTIFVKYRKDGEMVKHVQENDFLEPTLPDITDWSSIKWNKVIKYVDNSQKGYIMPINLKKL